VIALAALAACTPAPPSPTALVSGSADRATVPPSVAAVRTGPSWHLAFHLPVDARLAADFTDWAPVATREFDVPPGVHRYKIVREDRWEADPDNPLREPDGFGGVNSALRLGVPDPATARQGDARVDADAITQQLWPHGQIRVRTLRGDVRAVSLLPGDQPLARVASGTTLDTWEAIVAVNPGQTYEIAFDDGGAPALLPCRAPDPLPADDTPMWAREATWYQVFPDRFRNGDAANDPPGTRPWNAGWDVPFPAIWSMHLGGDFAGIEAGLGHIASLGTDAIYLGPVWAAPSPHRYDATSWVHVDPELGAGERLLPLDDWRLSASDQQLVALIAAIHARGMKVVLDGVFDHVGRDHPAARPGSPLGHWLLRGPDGSPVGWGGSTDLLVLDHDAPDVQDHILAVARRWLDPDGDGDPSDGADGWRLDVADEVPAPFWRRFRSEVRAVNPDAVLIGEVWKHAERWTSGDTFDGVTDYGFAAAILRYLETSDASALVAALADADTPPPAAEVSWTLLDSHDTDRAVSRLDNPGHPFDRENRRQDDPGYRAGRPTAGAFERVRLAAFLQATLPGSPVIWQGDEVGVWGADDPDNRRPLPWPDAGAPAPGEPRWDPDQLAWYREVFGLRRELAALRTAPLETLVARDGLWVYRRGDIVAAVNAGNADAQLPPLPAGAVRRIGASDAVLGPRSAALWVATPSPL
jgi:glycosidase